MFKQIKPEELDFNAFKTIGKEWLLVTAEKDGKCNTMTASWGGLGIMWNKPVAYIFVRPQRYTAEFIDASERLTLSVLPENYRKDLQYFGTVSGRDEDKIDKSGLALLQEGNTAYFADSNTAFICRKLYRQHLTKSSFIDKTCDTKNYPNQDYHIMYVVEIEKVLVKE